MTREERGQSTARRVHQSIGAAFALARVVPDMVFAPVLMSGIAVSLIVFVAKRRDLRRIASLVFAVFVGLMLFVGLAKIVYECSASAVARGLFSGVALLIAVVVIAIVHLRLRGAD